MHVFLTKPNVYKYFILFYYFAFHHNHIQCCYKLFYRFCLKNFRDFRPTSLEKGQELMRLRIYQMYAWGVPFVICLVAIVLDNLAKSPEDTFLRPRFGEKKCWFYGLYLFICWLRLSIHFLTNERKSNCLFVC